MPKPPNWEGRRPRDPRQFDAGTATPSLRADLALLRRLLSLARPFWPYLAGILLVNLLATPVTLLTPVPVKIVVDSAIGSRPIPGFLRAVVPASFTRSKTDIVVIAVVLLMAVALLDQLQGLGSTLLRAYTGERLVMGFRSRLFRHAQRLSISYHDRQGTWDSVYRIQYDTAAIQNVSIDGVIPFLTAAFKLVAMIWVTMRIDWSLALVALTISPILFLLSRTYRPRLRKQSRAVRSLESSALSVVQEALSVVRVVKAFGREDQEEERYVQRATEGIRARVRLALAEGQYGLMVGLTSAVGTAAVLWIGVRHVQSGALSVGNLLLVLSYLGNLYGPLRTIGKQAASLQGNLASAERAFSVFDQAPDVAETPHPRPLERAKGAVEFQDVSFAYAEGAQVLHDIALAVPAGARVGIAGRTGAGKTTLMSLLTRFYDPSGGRILLDGIDLREYKLADLRNQFAIVLQEPVLFSSSIAENIAYARPEASQEEVERAAKLADAHDFITALTEGYETMVGERGMMLSGGERQRISLARAFLKDAPILLLDEPTSSVDTKTEAAIMEAMERLMHGRTSFIIAHRASTLENCDVRMELEQGRIVSLKGTAPAVRE